MLPNEEDVSLDADFLHACEDMLRKPHYDAKHVSSDLVRQFDLRTRARANRLKARYVTIYQRTERFVEEWLQQKERRHAPLERDVAVAKRRIEAISGELTLLEQEGQLAGSDVGKLQRIVSKQRRKLKEFDITKRQLEALQDGLAESISRGTAIVSRLKPLWEPIIHTEQLSRTVKRRHFAAKAKVVSVRALSLVVALVIALVVDKIAPTIEFALQYVDLFQYQPY
jgi:hypothetical protein